MADASKIAVSSSMKFNLRDVFVRLAGLGRETGLDAGLDAGRETGREIGFETGLETARRLGAGCGLDTTGRDAFGADALATLGAG